MVSCTVRPRKTGYVILWELTGFTRLWFSRATVYRPAVVWPVAA